jgi:hypothetical protein
MLLSILEEIRTGADTIVQTMDHNHDQVAIRLDNIKTEIWGSSQKETNDDDSGLDALHKIISDHDKRKGKGK